MSWHASAANEDATTKRGFVVLTLEFEEEDGRWVGWCVELGTATDGPTLKQVREELIELVRLHLNALEDTGECDRFLKEQSVKFYTDHPPTEVQQKLLVDRPSFIHTCSFPTCI